uniref:ARAD1A06050p n=1 Tax=Blastobotrys adeninivorans TaxID=409370 RepID=A0A060T281_BLAAD
MRRPRLNITPSPATRFIDIAATEHRPMSWQEVISQRLDDRDATEKKLDSIIGAFEEAADRASSKGIASSIESQGGDELSKLYTEYSRKEDELSAAKNDLMQTRQRLQTAEQEAKESKTKVEKLEESVKVLTRTCQNLKDDILALQIQLNVSEDNNSKLKKENEELVDRWMKRVAGEAEKLNDVNEFIENMNRMRKSPS